MNSAIFEEWFENSVLKMLEEPSVIVCDNASYHSRILNPRPTSSWRKPEILQYMTSHNIPIPDPIPIIPQLLQIIELNLPPSERMKKYAIDEMAAQYGHIVLRLPPYYCVLNPIELVWSQIKRKVQSKNLKTHPLEEIVLILRSVCDDVTQEHWENYIQHVEKIENTYRMLNPVFDNEVVIPINESEDEYGDSEEEAD